MKKKVLLCLLSFCSLFAWAQRQETLLEKNWKFTKGDAPEAVQETFDDTQWETVTVPHDWAIYGPFDRSHDLQNVAVKQNFETQASVKTFPGVRWCHERGAGLRERKRSGLLAAGV